MGWSQRLGGAADRAAATARTDRYEPSYATRRRRAATALRALRRLKQHPSCAFPLRYPTNYTLDSSLGAKLRDLRQE